MTPADWLTLIEARAPGLRAAGVQSVTLEGATIKLAPYVGESVATGEVVVPVEEPDLTNPLDDPMTFGGILPGYQIPATRPQPADDEVT